MLKIHENGGFKNTTKLLISYFTKEIYLHLLVLSPLVQPSLTTPVSCRGISRRLSLGQLHEQVVNWETTALQYHLGEMADII